MSKQKKDTARYTNSTVVQVMNPNNSDVKSAYATGNIIKSEYNSPISNNNNYQISSDGSTVSSASNNSNFRNQSGGTTPNSFRNNQDKSIVNRNYRPSRGGATMNQVTYRQNPDINHQQNKKQKYIIQDHFSPNRRIQHFLISHWKNFIHQYHIKDQKTTNGWKRINSPDNNQISNNSSMSTSFDSNLSSPLTPDMNSTRSNSNSTNAKRSTPTLNNSPPNFTYHPSHQQHIKKAASPMQNNQQSLHANNNWNSNNGNSMVNGSVKKPFVAHNGQLNGEKHSQKKHNQNTPPHSKNNSFDHSTSNPVHHNINSNEPKPPSLSPTGLNNGHQRDYQATHVAKHSLQQGKSLDSRPLNDALKTAPIVREKKSFEDLSSSQKVDQTLTILSRNNRDENRHSESCASTNKSQCSILNGVNSSITPTSCSSTNKTRHQSASSTSLTALSSGGASIDRGDTPNTIEQYYTPEPPSSPSTNPGANSPE